MIKSYEDLDAYKNSQKLYPIVVKVTTKYPREGFKLGDQTRRAANGIHACIAEGWSRSVIAFKDYLTRSLGSCNEVKTHLQDAKAVGYLKPETADKLIEKYTIVGKQIYRLREKWK
jgi:four helix bundle protein